MNITNKKSLLITGVNGFLASNIVDKLSRNFKITGIDKQQSKEHNKIDFFKLDITDLDQVNAFFSTHQFDIIIHCAALINVDLCEEDYQLAYNINAVGTKNLVANFSGLFLYVSTDMLFDGIDGNYSEESNPNPINNYGKTKLAGENFVREYTKNHLILRTNFFGWNHYSDKQTFAEWIYDSLLENSEISLFYDYHFCPIFIDDFIKIMKTLLNSKYRGTFNAVGKDCISKLEFGELIAKRFNLQTTNIKKSSIKDHSFKAQRPPNMSLTTQKLLNSNVFIPSINEGIDNFFNDQDK
jgi:dTDP-4-dehydrorhamnose reductase